ncbi:outer membrane protein assembly factor BamD [bacterium]|nr:outer membrane protein assembly factor BamD [bacterium]
MTKNRIINILLILTSIGIIVSCAGKKPVEQLPLEERYKHGQEFLENKKYYNAQQEFQIIVLSGSHTELGDDAQFYLAESYYLNKEYILAISEYERLTRKMKYSPFVEKARWRICEAYVAESPKYYHDQANTEKALQKLQEFIEEYPDSEYRAKANITVSKLRYKLAEKVYESALLYIKLHAYDSAIVAFEDLLRQYYDTDLAEKAHVGIIQSYSLMKNVEDAKNYYKSNESKILSNDLKEKALEYISAAGSNKK